MAHPTLVPGDADNLGRFADRVEDGLGRVTRGRDRQPVRQALILIGCNDPLTGNVGSRCQHIRWVQVAQVFWFVGDLLIAGGFHGHNTALPRNVLQSQHGDCGGGVGVGRDEFSSRRFGLPVLRSLPRKRLPEIQGQCQVARHRPVEDNLPQVRFSASVAGVGRMPLFDDSGRRVYRNNLDLLTDGRGQCEPDVSYLSVPDV